MSRIGVWGKKSSFFSHMFGAVHRVALRCVAVMAIAISTLFMFDVTPAQAYNGVQFHVTPTSSILSVSMQFNFSGTLTITATGATCKFADTGNLISSSGDTFVSGTPRTVTCAYSSAGNYYIRLYNSSVSGYPSYTNTSTAPAAATYSTFRFSENPTIVKAITGTLGDVFYTLSSGGNGNQPLFIGTFSGCTGLSTIPNNLFAGGDAHSDGISGTAAYWMFAQTFANTGISALPSRGSDSYGLFRSLTPAIGMFYRTFYSCTNLTGTSALTADIFYSMRQTPAARMFYGMFESCTKMTSVPSGFFGRFSSNGGSAPQYLFYQTFLGCTNLQTIIGIFTGVNAGRGTSYMFRETFKSSGLKSLPANLFSSFSVSLGSSMFQSTFESCAKLTTLDSTIFTGMYNVPSPNLFQYTFRNCAAITEVPAGFFSNFTGQPSSNMFNNTFAGCTTLQTITNIFLGVGSAVTSTTKTLPTYLFYATFSGCTKLAPGNTLIFAPFDGWNIATYDFYRTFYNCDGEAELNPNLFKGIKGTPANYAFYQMFYGCDGLYGEVPANLFSGLSGAMGTNAFYQMFYNCKNLGKTSTAASTGTHYIHPWLFYNMTASSAAPVSGIFYSTALVESCPSSAPNQYTGAPYNTISSNFNSKAVCEPTMPATKFSMTLTALSAGDVISFSIRARGDFYVRWKSGAPVEKVSTSSPTFSHTYPVAASAGTITIELSSANVTGYTGGNDYGVLRIIDGITKIKQANLSLGSLFPTVSPGTAEDSRPNFRGVFMGATSLESISSTLFSGVTGSTLSSSNNLFKETFSGCTALASIPSQLFSSITTTSVYMFEETFSGCTSLTSIPGGLFSSITTPRAGMFKETFSGCTGLNQVLPSGLFGGLTGNVETQQFKRTFLGCTNLPGPLPENLFGSLGGTITSEAFMGMFDGCSSLSGYIPPRLFMNFTKWTTGQDQMKNIFRSTNLATLATSCSGFADAPYQFYTGYESGSTNNTNNSFGGKISCFNGLTITTNSISSFSFGLSAGGNFYVGWGDDKFDVITRASATQTTSSISHTYGTSSTRTIQIGGLANAYYRHSTSTVDSNTAGTSYSVISFYNNTTITGLSGSLMLMFPSFIKRVMQLGGGYEFLFYTPYFPHAFRKCTNLTSLPSSLFAGANVAVTTPYMFYYTFQGDTGLTSIPGDLFSSITGNASTQMFGYAFYGCSGVTSLPANLFSYIGTTPGRYMFAGTFINTSITSIPTNFFSRFDGQVPSAGMFHDTFQGTRLTQVPNVFKNLSGDISSSGNAFHRTFYNCTGMYGDLPSDMFENLTGTIPDRMFYQTFYGCTNLGKNAVGGTSTYYIPSTFFGGIIPNANATEPTLQMFTGTGLLTECPGLLNQYFTGFETFVDGSNSPKVSCKRCAYLPGEASYGHTCYDLCNLNGDNMTKLHVGDNWFYLFAQSEATNFMHHLNFKYGNNATDICFVPLDDSGWGASNSGSLNFNTGTVKYHAKRSGTTSRAGGEQSKTKSVATEPEQKTKQ